MGYLWTRHKDRALATVAAAAILLTLAGAWVMASWLGVLPDVAAFSQGANLSSLGWQATNPPGERVQVGPLGAILTSPENVKLQVVAVQRVGPRWLFHIHAHNNTRRRVTIWGSGADHFFMIAGISTPGTPVTFSQTSLRLGPLTGADLASHTTLPTMLSGGADADGWLMADLSHFPYPPDDFVYYVYGTITTPACADIHDPSTCHPSTSYRTMLWRL